MHHCCKSQTVGWEETSTAGGNFFVSAGENNSSTVHNNLKCKELLWIDDAIRHQWCGDTLAAKSLRGSLQSSATQMMMSVVYQSKNICTSKYGKDHELGLSLEAPAIRPIHLNARQGSQRNTAATNGDVTVLHLLLLFNGFLIVEIWSDPRWKLPGCKRFRV